MVRATPYVVRMGLGPEDLTVTADACRALAQRYRDDAERYEHAVLRDAALARARHAERLADFFERQRDRA